MALAALALTLLPIIGLLLFIIKTVLKVSFSVIRVIAVLFVVWFVYVLFSGSLFQAIDGIGGPSVEQHGDRYTVNAAFSDGELDLSQSQSRVMEVKVNGVASTLRIKLPESTVVQVKHSGAIINTNTQNETEFFLVGWKGDSQVYGSGTNLVQIEVVAAFCNIELEF